MKIKSLKKFLFYLVLLFVFICFLACIAPFLIMDSYDLDNIFIFFCLAGFIYWINNILMKIDKIEKNTREAATQLNQLESIYDCLNSINYQLYKKFNPDDYEDADHE